MRKQTKLVAVISDAALLAIGASMTSLAAQGWQQEGDDWYYYDNNGDAVTDDWKKSGNRPTAQIPPKKRNAWSRESTS